jgi:hypothetical protein
MVTPNPPRVLSRPGKLFLALLAGALGGMGGGICAVVAALLLSGAGDVSELVGAAVFGLSGGGAVSLFLSKNYLRTSWREAAAQMYMWFGLMTVAALGVGSILSSVLRWRRLVLPESAPLVTAVLLLGLPALGGMGAAAFSVLLLSRRRRA